MTPEQAERVRAEAELQGWTADKDVREYPYGRADVMHFQDGVSCVDLHWPDLIGPKYWIREWDEWRQLKAKVDEIQQIVAEAAQRGWEVEGMRHLGIPVPQKAGKAGMYIEVYPPGYRRPYAARVGGLRTWRKLCREADAIIEGDVIEAPQLGQGE